MAGPGLNGKRSNEKKIGEMPTEMFFILNPSATMQNVILNIKKQKERMNTIR